MKTSNGTVGGLKTPIIISDTTRVHCSAFQIQQQRKPSRPTMDHSQPSPRIQHYQAIGTLLVHNPVTTLSTTYRVASSNLIVAMTITTQVDGGSRCLLLLLLICWIHTRLNPNKEANQHAICCSETNERQENFQCYQVMNAWPHATDHNEQLHQWYFTEDDFQILVECCFIVLFCFVESEKPFQIQNSKFTSI